MLKNLNLIQKLFCVLLLAGLNLAEPNTIKGTNGYVEWQPGNINIIISVPHEGSLRPDSIESRTDDKNLLSDVRSRTIANSFAAELSRLFLVNTGKNIKPFVVYNNLHRKKMDANRDPSECCGYSATGESDLAHTEYHAIIKQNFSINFVKNGPNKYKQSILFDIHGQTHDEDWIEAGYGLDKSDLNKPLLKNSLSSSFKTLVSLNNVSLEEAIRGKNSIGALLEKNFRIVPSSSIPSPLTGTYYNGGYIIRTHGIDEDENLNAVQLEFPSSARAIEAAQSTGVKVAKAAYDFYFLNSLDATY